MQTYANHAKFVPPYHFVAVPILLINAGYALAELRHGLTFPSVMFAATSIALILIAWFARIFALRVQDRVIRLEMRLRLAPLVSADQIARLSVGQMVGLRFATDAELPGLVNAALKDNLTGGAIKKMITTWVPDEVRA